MSNKDAFRKAEANNWFQRNIEHLKASTSEPSTTLLCEWLHPFMDGINTIAEIGSGSGHRLSTVCSQLNASGIGIEPSAEAVAFANANFDNIRAQVGFGDNLDLDTESVDLAVMGFFLYLVDREDFLHCIAEADRILKPGGFLAIIDFDTAQPKSNDYHHFPGVKSFKQDNAQPFLSSGKYYLVNKFSFSHSDFHFSRDIDERVSLSLLYKETDAFS